eukprot:6184009-Pleurochrysis_carterae.AAC.9
MTEVLQGAPCLRVELFEAGVSRLPSSGKALSQLGLAETHELRRRVLILVLRKVGDVGLPQTRRNEKGKVACRYKWRTCTRLTGCA